MSSIAGTFGGEWQSGSDLKAGFLHAREVNMLPTLVEQYRRWFDYEKDSHRQVLASLDTVPEENRGSEPFQKALSILGHIIAARRTWLHRFEPSKFEKPTELFPTGATRNSLEADLTAMERDWSEYFQRLTDSELERVFTYQSSDGHGFRNVVNDVLTQLYGHSLYHRGQIASLVRAAGGEPARTDFIFWSRESIDPASAS
jgi:uncharacterized damage-inducible protein DinB